MRLPVDGAGDGVGVPPNTLIAHPGEPPRRLIPIVGGDRDDGLLVAERQGDLRLDPDGLLDKQPRKDQDATRLADLEVEGLPKRGEAGWRVRNDRRAVL